MRTHVEFRSDAFPAEPREEEKINLGCWGAALARYLRQLSTQDFSVKEPYSEDWGYAVEIENPTFKSLDRLWQPRNISRWLSVFHRSGQAIYTEVFPQD